jgi:hypothetical protein
MSMEEWWNDDLQGIADETRRKVVTIDLPHVSQESPRIEAETAPVTNHLVVLCRSTLHPLQMQCKLVIAAVEVAGVRAESLVRYF